MIATEPTLNSARCNRRSKSAEALQCVSRLDGFLKILRPDLPAGDFALLLLYQRGVQGATLQELEWWVRPAMRQNLSRTLRRLVDDLALAHFDGQRYLITRLGEHEVERRQLLQPNTVRREA